jgi:hypothetical protein
VLLLLLHRAKHAADRADKQKGEGIHGHACIATTGQRAAAATRTASSGACATLLPLLPAVGAHVAHASAACA